MEIASWKWRTRALISFLKILILQNGVSVHETVNKGVTKVTKINNRGNNSEWLLGGCTCVRSLILFYHSRKLRDNI